jgi:TetR/AcrR family transcriptional repressor of mexJK operon
MNMQADILPRRTGKRADKGDAILEAAARVFLADGFASSVDRIAAEAGVAKQTIYSRFGSKEGLLRAMAERLKAPLYDVLQPEAPAKETLTRFAGMTFDRMTAPENIRLTRLLIAQAGQFPDLAQLHYDTGPCRSRDALALYLERLVALKRMAPTDCAKAAETFVALLQGLHRHRLLLGAGEAPTPEERAGHVDQVVAQFRKLYDVAD